MYPSRSKTVQDLLLANLFFAGFYSQSKGHHVPVPASSPRLCLLLSSLFLGGPRTCDACSILRCLETKICDADEDPGQLAADGPPSLHQPAPSHRTAAAQTSQTQFTVTAWGAPSCKDFQRWTSDPWNNLPILWRRIIANPSTVVLAVPEILLPLLRDYCV